MNETGQEGEHSSSYEAHQQADGITYKKTRLTNPFQHGESHHEKVRVYFCTWIKVILQIPSRHICRSRARAEEQKSISSAQSSVVMVGSTS